MFVDSPHLLKKFIGIDSYSQYKLFSHKLFIFIFIRKINLIDEKYFDIFFIIKKSQKVKIFLFL